MLDSLTCFILSAHLFVTMTDVIGRYWSAVLTGCYWSVVLTIHAAVQLLDKIPEYFFSSSIDLANSVVIFYIQQYHTLQTSYKYPTPLC